MKGSARMNSKAKTTDMKEEARYALVPKLRFPEFIGAGGWEKKYIGDFFNVGSSKRVLQQDWIAQGIPFYRTRELVSLSKKERFSSEIFISRSLFEEITKKYGAPREGDFLISGVGTLGISYLVKKGDEFYFKDGNVIWFSRKGGISSQFFKYCFESDVIQNQILKQSSVSTVGTYTIQNAKKTKFYSPPTEKEQQKIAECLSSVDELIAAQARKVDALKTHKKGLMQQLFPREGETKPRFRFSNVGNWILMELPKVAFFQEGPGIMAVDFHSEGMPLVRLAGVSGSVVTLNGCNYLDPLKVRQKWSHFRLELNDLLISTSATFGLSSIVTEVAAGAVFYTGLIRFKPSSDRLDRGYLKVYLGSPHFEKQAESAAVGGGIKHFGPTHLKQMEIPIPPVAEQQKIAMCLSSLDALITAETQKLEALKAHKKGLMQQLFPSAVEPAA